MIVYYLVNSNKSRYFAKNLSVRSQNFLSMFSKILSAIAIIVVSILILIAVGIVITFIWRIIKNIFNID